MMEMNNSRKKVGIEEKFYEIHVGSQLRINIGATDNETLDDANFVIHPTTERYIQGIILVFICGVAIVGNVSLWIIVLRTRSLRTVTNSFLLVLSTFDLMVSVTSMPITILTLFSGRWLFSDTVCRGLGFLNMIALCGSVLSLCNISINRYVMVCKATQFCEIYTKRGASCMIIGSVIGTIGVSIPPLVGWCEYVYTPEQYVCFANWSSSLSYALFMIFCCFGIPLCVMTICNLKIYQKVKQTKTKIRDANKLQLTKGELEQSSKNPTGKNNINVISKSIGELFEIVDKDTKGKQKRHFALHIDVTATGNIDSASKKATTEEIRLTRVLAIVVLVFFVCWVPYCISMILSIILPNRVHRIFHMFTLIVGYFNSCCNPIIYGILNKRFNRGFKLLCCFWRKKMIMTPDTT